MMDVCGLLMVPDMLLPVFIELYNKIEEMRENLPTYEDLSGSVSALLRLQDTYKLETTELARGNVGGVASPELSGKLIDS